MLLDPMLDLGRELSSTGRGLLIRAPRRRRWSRVGGPESVVPSRWSRTSLERCVSHAVVLDPTFSTTIVLRAGCLLVSACGTESCSLFGKSEPLTPAFPRLTRATCEWLRGSVLVVSNRFLTVSGMGSKIRNSHSFPCVPEHRAVKPSASSSARERETYPGATGEPRILRRRYGRGDEAAQAGGRRRPRRS